VGQTRKSTTGRRVNGELMRKLPETGRGKGGRKFENFLWKRPGATRLEENAKNGLDEKSYGPKTTFIGGLGRREKEEKPSKSGVCSVEKIVVHLKLAGTSAGK